MLDMLPSACPEDLDKVNLDIFLILTIIFAFASFVLELLYISSTINIIKKLKLSFDKNNNPNKDEKKDKIKI